MQLSLALPVHAVPSPNLPSEDIAANARLRAAVLARLERGPATGPELEAVGGNRYGARLHELKQAGVRWDKKPVGKRIYLYFLEAEK